MNRVDSEVFDSESFYRNLKHIMAKYVEWDSEYSVNISAAVRNEILEAFEQILEKRKVIQAIVRETICATSTTALKSNDSPRVPYNIYAFMKVIEVAMQDV